MYYPRTPNGSVPPTPGHTQSIAIILLNRRGEGLGRIRKLVLMSSEKTYMEAVTPGRSLPFKGNLGYSTLPTERTNHRNILGILKGILKTSRLCLSSL